MLGRPLKLEEKTKETDKLTEKSSGKMSTVAADTTRASQTSPRAAETTVGAPAGSEGHAGLAHRSVGRRGSAGPAGPVDRDAGRGVHDGADGHRGSAGLAGLAHRKVGRRGSARPARHVGPADGDVVAEAPQDQLDLPIVMLVHGSQ